MVGKVLVVSSEVGIPCRLGNVEIGTRGYSGLCLNVGPCLPVWLPSTKHP